jgi:hypothetical protein
VSRGYLAQIVVKLGISGRNVGDRNWNNVAVTNKWQEWKWNECWKRRKKWHEVAKESSNGGEHRAYLLVRVNEEIMAVLNISLEIHLGVDGK